MANVTTLGKMSRLQLFTLILGISVVVCFCQFIGLDRNEQKTNSQQIQVENNRQTSVLVASSIPTVTFPNGNRSFSTEAIRIVDQFNLETKNESKPEMLDDGKITFVTGTSDDHLNELRRMIGQFVKVYPNETLLVYNLGLTTSAQINLTEQFGFVRLINFPFGNYPPYVANLKEYRWKSLIIAEVLMSHSRVLWMDTSILLYKPVPLDQFDGVRLFGDTGHSILATTNPLMYEYLPKIGNLGNIHMHTASMIGVRNCQFAKVSVLRWWLLCALERDCMSPVGSHQICPAKLNENPNVYANCHRWDQSAINLILLHQHHLNTSYYAATFTKFKIGNWY